MTTEGVATYRLITAPLKEASSKALCVYSLHHFFFLEIFYLLAYLLPRCLHVNSIMIDLYLQYLIYVHII